MTPEQKQPERTIDKLHRETGISMWALETAFELSTLGMLDEETMAGLRVIPDAARIIAANAATSMRSRCVEKVRAMGQQWYADAKKRGAAFSDKGRLAEMIAKELESVSIQEQENRDVEKSF